MAQVAVPSYIPDSAELKDAQVVSGPTAVLNGNIQYQRRLGDNEQSYYLPSRGDGVNDM